MIATTAAIVLQLVHASGQLKLQDILHVCMIWVLMSLSFGFVSSVVVVDCVHGQ